MQNTIWLCRTCLDRRQGTNWPHQSTTSNQQSVLIHLTFFCLLLLFVAARSIKKSNEIHLCLNLAPIHLALPPSLQQQQEKLALGAPPVRRCPQTIFYRKKKCRFQTQRGQKERRKDRKEDGEESWGYVGWGGGGWMRWMRWSRDETR